MARQVDQDDDGAPEAPRPPARRGHQKVPITNPGPTGAANNNRAPPSRSVASGSVAGSSESRHSEKKAAGGRLTLAPSCEGVSGHRPTKKSTNKDRYFPKETTGAGLQGGGGSSRGGPGYVFRGGGMGYDQQEPRQNETSKQGGTFGKNPKRPHYQEKDPTIIDKKDVSGSTAVWLAPVIAPPPSEPGSSFGTQEHEEQLRSFPARGLPESPHAEARPLVNALVSRPGKVVRSEEQVGAFQVAPDGVQTGVSAEAAAEEEQSQTSSAPDNASTGGIQDQEAATSAIYLEAELAPDTDAIIAEREELRRQLEFEREMREAGIQDREPDGARQGDDPGKDEDKEDANHNNLPSMKVLFIIMLVAAVVVAVAAGLLSAFLVGSKQKPGEPPGVGDTNPPPTTTTNPSPSPAGTESPVPMEAATDIPTEVSSLPPTPQPTVAPTFSPSFAPSSQAPTPFWAQIGDDIVGEGQNYQFGYSVAMSDDGRILAGGAYFSSASGNQKAGRVRVFERIDGEERNSGQQESRGAGISWSQLGQSLDGDGPDDQFGTSVSLSASGTTLAAGADQSFAADNSAGYVRVYRLAGDTWDQLGNDIPGEADSDRFGRTLSLSRNGSIVAVGARGGGENGFNSGNVRVFQYDGNVQDWVQLGQSIPGAEPGDLFGFSVSISDNQGNRILAVGALNARDTGGVDTGHVRVFRFNGSFWLPLGPTLYGDSSGDQFGNAVSLSLDGTVLAVGAHLSDGAGFADGGQARVFLFDGTNWNQLGDPLYGEAAWDEFGSAIALSADGSTLVVGAQRGDGNGDLSGEISIFEYNPTGGGGGGGAAGAWAPLGSKIQGEDMGDQFGWSAAIAADPDTGCRVIAAGARGGENFYGHIRVFEEASCAG